MKTDERCKECKKDWTKCGRCPVMMKWVNEHKIEVKKVKAEGSNKE